LSFLKNTYTLLLGATLLLPLGVWGQSKSETYLFHFLPFKDEHPAEAPHGRVVKVRLDFGLCSQLIKTDPNYTIGTTGGGSYTIGLKLDIPILRNDAIITGFEFVRGSFNFDSYFFAKGYSFLYDSNKIYNADIDFDELQIPIEYKFNFSSETRNIKTFYCTVGWMLRYIFYDNTYVTNVDGTANSFVYEGQNAIQSAFPLFTKNCSGIIEAGLGYQHNTLKSGNAWFFEIQFKYGTSPLIYTGNNAGSNYVQYTLSTFSYQLGWRF
jgi:hypothetical protein